MSKTTKHMAVAMVLCLAAIPAVAQQEGNLWGADGDVDQDGQVSVTDIQHVINRALDLPQEDPNRQFRPARRYVVASPRAALMNLRTPDGASVPCPVVGEAFNFPQRDGAIVVHTGAEISFALDWNIEGVWYEGACGLLGTHLLLDGTVADDTVEPEWQRLGRSDAAGRRCGPGVGTARVEVRHRFMRPGDFVVRARVITHAVPAAELPPPPPPPEGEPSAPEGEPPAPEGEPVDPGTGGVTDSEDLGGNGDPNGPGNPNDPEPIVIPSDLVCGDVAIDNVFIHVRVVDTPPTEDDVAAWQDIPDAIMGQWGDILPPQPIVLEGDPQP